MGNTYRMKQYNFITFTSKSLMEKAINICLLIGLFLLLLGLYGKARHYAASEFAIQMAGLLIIPCLIFWVIGAISKSRK